MRRGTLEWDEVYIKYRLDSTSGNAYTDTLRVLKERGYGLRSISLDGAGKTVFTLQDEIGSGVISHLSSIGINLVRL